MLVEIRFIIDIFISYDDHIMIYSELSIPWVELSGKSDIVTIMLIYIFVRLIFLTEL